MAQKVFSSVQEPSGTVLSGEISGYAGLSSHNRKAKFQFADARNMMSFVDGHVSYIKRYWNGVLALEGFPFFYEPKPGYEYKWSGN
jgi:prepilin-type processing-associated H-X9-DG protein